MPTKGFGPAVLQLYQAQFRHLSTGVVGKTQQADLYRNIFYWHCHFGLPVGHQLKYQ